MPWAESAGSALLVFVGAGLGACLRWALALWLNTPWAWLPWGTWLANALGALGAGVLWWGLQVGQWSFTEAGPVQAWRLFAITGVLGGLTTFSTFSLEVFQVLQRGHWPQVVALLALHVLGSVALVAAGWALARAVSGA